MSLILNAVLILILTTTQKKHKMAIEEKAELSTILENDLLKTELKTNKNFETLRFAIRNTLNIIHHDINDLPAMINKQNNIELVEKNN
jgi:hypothetical protein